jgi:hypothetical protein
VPVSRLPGLTRHPRAFYETKVVESDHWSVRVDIPNGEVSERIGSSLCYRNVSILILNFGDFESEEALLDPLAHSVYQFCRLLASDGYVRSYKLRSIAELTAIWQIEQTGYSHIILIGHGNGTGLKFGVDNWIMVDRLETPFTRAAGGVSKIFLSLSCQSGYKSFGGRFSEFPICADFIGPFHPVHGAIASQFTQTFLSYHLLEGETVRVAHRHARESVPGSTSFRLWRGGTLQ